MQSVPCTYESEVVATQPYVCHRSGSPISSDRIPCPVVKVCAQSSKNECNFVLQNVPLSLLVSINELKTYLQSHLSLGVVMAVGYFYKGRKKIWLQRNQELTQLVEKELSCGKGALGVRLHLASMSTEWTTLVMRI